eukprot:TRINITY_DN3072_c0_g1_i1.p1 TRINITY_DN3072_c0_g1~~TRINITY_DN3072_c0_g1_i1.p1  ORF type:complete len:228 (-),score=37.95 TRINITY_DN3072_c0_g1_i1:34-717(-)
MASPLIGAGFMNAIVFFSYGLTKQLVLGSTPERSMTLGQSFFCGAGAGFGAGTINGPIELIRTKLQVQTQGASGAMYKGPIDVIVKSFKYGGILGPFKGLGATYLRDIPQYAFYFATYEIVRNLLTPTGKTVDDLSVPRLMVSGGLAGVAGWIMTYPVDVVKSRVQAQSELSVVKYKGIIDCALRSYRNEGFGVFFKGLETTLARAFPVNAAVFVAYEAARKFLRDV